MKATCTIFLLLFLAVINSAGQTIQSYPIPSYSVPVTGLANFTNSVSQMDTCDSNRGKRKVVIRVKATDETTLNCTATVWVYTLDMSSILGPFQVSCGSTIEVDIDDRNWGVLVQSGTEVIVDVFYSDE